MRKLLILATIAVMPQPSWAQETGEVSAKAPPVECHVTLNRADTTDPWPGYLRVEDGQETCLPFMPTGHLAPADYAGDYYVEAFTDAKVRAAFAACEAEGATCLDGQMAAITGLGAENTFRQTGTLTPEARFDPLDGDIDLSLVRRPAFFGKAPYGEDIAAAEDRTYTVEVEVPSEANEHEFMAVPEDQTWRLRGWYLEGNGVADADGALQRALIVMVSGRTIEMTAIQHPEDLPYTYDTATKTFESVSYPTERSEKWGMDIWRDYILAMNAAGFDVLALDKRGHGISGGRNASNNVEMARDIFRTLDAFQTGEGLRLMTPDGQLLEGATAAGRLLAGQEAKQIPLFLAGTSQGSMVVAFAMHDVFVGDCAFDAADATCGPKRDYNVKAGMLLAEFAKGPGYAPARIIREGAYRQKYHIAYLPTSEIMAGIGSWPATFIGRGLWDTSGGLEGTLDLYNRAAAPKELVVVGGPHSELEYGPENIAWMQTRMAAFASAVMAGKDSIPGAAEFSNLKELVLSAPPYWQPANAPDPH